MIYRFLIRVRNAENEIGTCLVSLEHQTLKDYQAFVFIDCPTDNTSKIIKKYSKKHNKIHYFENKKHLGLAHNLWKGIKYLVSISDPEDVICILDGDDYLRNDALKIVDRMYRKHPDTLITYGSFYRIDKGRKTRTSKETLRRLAAWDLLAANGLSVRSRSVRDVMFRGVARPTCWPWLTCHHCLQASSATRPRHLRMSAFCAQAIWC